MRKNKIKSWLKGNKKPSQKGKITKTYEKRASKCDTPNKKYNITKANSKKIRDKIDIQQEKVPK